MSHFRNLATPESIGFAMLNDEKSYILDAMRRAEKREANDDSKDDEFSL